MLATPEQRFDAFRRSIRANVSYWRTAPETTVQNTRVADHVWQNVIRAILYACEERSAWVEAARLAIGLFDVMQHRGAWHEWGAVLRRLADALADQPGLRSRLLGQLGQCLLLDGQHQAALEVLHLAEALALEVKDPELIARSRVSICEACRLLHHYAEAERVGRLALADLEDLPGIADTGLMKAAVFTSLGLSFGYVGRFDEGRDQLLRALASLDTARFPAEASRICNNLVTVLWLAGRPIEALPILDQASGYLSALPHASYDRASIGISKGTTHFSLGQLKEAEAAFRAIDLADLRRKGYWNLVAWTTNNLGNVHQQQGRFLEAGAELAEALALMRNLDDDVELANILLTLGEVIEAQGRRSEAEPLWREAVERAEKHPTDTRAQRYAAKGRKYLAG